MSSEMAAGMELLIQTQEICFKRDFSRQDLERLKAGFEPTYTAMYPGKYL